MCISESNLSRKGAQKFKDRIQARSSFHSVKFKKRSFASKTSGKYKGREMKSSCKKYSKRDTSFGEVEVVDLEEMVSQTAEIKSVIGADSLSNAEIC